MCRIGAAIVREEEDARIDCGHGEQRFGLLFVLIIICAKNPDTVQIVILLQQMS